MSGVTAAFTTSSATTRYCLAEGTPIVLFRRAGRREELPYCALQRAIDHPAGLGLELLTLLQREQPQRVDHLALLIHDVIVLEQPFPGLEVLQLDTALGVLDGARDEPASDDLALLGAALVHPGGNPVRPEEPHQVVLEGQEEDRLARVALAA